LWVDSVDPKVIAESKSYGMTGATSNPVIIAEILQGAGYAEQIRKMKSQGKVAYDIAWQLNDQLVTAAEKVFLPVFQRTKGNDGYVSFELDPMIEDPGTMLSLQEKTDAYKRLGKSWAQDHPGRLIKVPGTEAGIAALADLVASGVNVNVTLLFTMKQYQRARAAVWTGARQREDLSNFKSVFSIFVSRLDVYAEKYLPQLSREAQQWLGVVTARRLWRDNQDFWAVHNTPLQQEIVFASTGTKSPAQPKWKYVAALAGSDIQTNPPATNEAVIKSGLSFESLVEERPPAKFQVEIDENVDWEKLERTLLDEGVEKFAAAQAHLIQIIENM
jgi:transaldolase